MNNYDYPAGADCDPNAPWKEKKYSQRKERVTASITISKTMDIYVEPDEETIEKDEDGSTYVHSTYIDNTLNNAVLSSSKIPDLNGWSIDDMAVILE